MERQFALQGVMVGECNLTVQAYVRDALNAAFSRAKNELSAHNNGAKTIIMTFFLFSVIVNFIKDLVVFCTYFNFDFTFFQTWQFSLSEK